MGNTIITPDLIGKEAVYQAVNQMVMARMVDRHYEKDFKGGQGETVNYPMPNKFIAQKGEVLDTKDVHDKKKPITVNERWHTSMKYPMQAKTLSMTEFSKKYIRPAMLPLANKVDAFLAGLGRKFYQAYGTAGTTPTAFEDFAGPRMVLDHAGVPQEDCHLVLDPTAKHKAAVFLAGLQNNTAGSGALRKGYVGDISNFDTSMDQNIVYHTSGSISGTPLVNGANQRGDTLIIDGFTGTIKAGDVFTIAGVNMVNAIEKTDTGRLQQFVAMEDLTGPGALKISPDIIGPNDATDPARQTVTCLAGDNATLTFTSSHRLNMAFHTNAIGLVTVPLDMPDSAGFKARYTYKGVSIRMVKGYDIINDIETMRFDVLFGGDVLYPEYGCRLLG